MGESESESAVAYVIVEYQFGGSIARGRVRKAICNRMETAVVTVVKGNEVW